MLARELQPLGEAARLHGARQQVGRHRLAARADLLEQRQHLGVVDPLLQHLRRRLDEVELDRGAGLRGIARVRQRDVQRMAELVQQRLQLVDRQALAVEVGHQRGRRQLAAPGRRAAQRPHRRVAVLVGAGVEVEVERGQRLAAGRVDHGIGLGVRVPQRLRHRLEAHAEQPAGECEHEVDAGLRREIAAEALLVERKALALDALDVVAHIPAFQRRGVGCGLQLGGLGRPQFGQVAFLALAQLALHLAEEGLHVAHVQCHAAAQREVGIALDAEQARVAAALLAQPRQRLQVRLAATRLEGPPHAFARHRAAGALHHR